jgi:hypothetical protein
MEIFPSFKLYNGKPFSTEKESDWKIKNSNVPKSNHIAVLEEGTTIGERASFAIIFDDLTKELKKSIVKLYIGKIMKSGLMNGGIDVTENVVILFLLALSGPRRHFNRIIEDRNKVSPLKKTSDPYVMESEDGFIVIRVPMLDEK